MPIPVVFPSPFDANDDLDAALLNAVADLIYEIGSVPQNAGVYFATFYPDEVIPINGSGAMIINYHVSILEAFGRKSGAAADGHEWQHGAFLNADTYTLTFRAIKTSDSGILKISIDGVLVATFDLYAAADAVSDLTQASIVLAGGWHTITGLVDGKNASSSDYYAKWVKMSMRGANA